MLTETYYIGQMSDLVVKFPSAANFISYYIFSTYQAYAKSYIRTHVAQRRESKT